MEVFITGLALKMVMSVVLWTMVQYTASAYDDVDESGPHLSFLAPLVVSMLITEVASNLVFISMIAFFSKISDPSIGASYMTPLNTLTNLGSKWITSLSLYLLPKMTFYTCEIVFKQDNGVETVQPLDYTCSSSGVSPCTKHGGACAIDLVSIV